MRVALITPEWPGCGPSFGVGAAVASIARSLEDDGAEVLALAVTAAGCFAGRAPWPPRRMRWPRTPALLRPIAAAPWLARMLRSFAPDVVEVQSWGGLGAGLPDRWPCVVRLHTPVSAIRAADLPRRLAAAVHHRREAAVVRRADVVIADSEAMRALGRAVFARDADMVVPHPWCGPVLPAQPRTSPEALFVGRLEHRKGVDVLLAAWRMVRASRADAVLHLVGADRHGFGAAMLHGHDRAGVVVHGAVDDAGLAALRARCCMQVVPSRFESFGIVVLEAWAAGLPVIACAAGALAEVVDDGGVLVPVDDAGALASGILDLLADAPTRGRLACAGQRRLRGVFAPATCAAANRAAYTLARRRRGWTR